MKTIIFLLTLLIHCAFSQDGKIIFVPEGGKLKIKYNDQEIRRSKELWEIIRTHGDEEMNSDVKKIKTHFWTGMVMYAVGMFAILVPLGFTDELNKNKNGTAIGIGVIGVGFITGLFGVRFLSSAKKKRYQLIEKFNKRKTNLSFGIKKDGVALSYTRGF